MTRSARIAVAATLLLGGTSLATAKIRGVACAWQTFPFRHQRDHVAPDRGGPVLSLVRLVLWLFRSVPWPVRLLCYAALQSRLQLRLRETGRLTIVWLAIIQLLPIRFFHVANKGLPTVVHMDVLDANALLPAMTQASKHLYLHRKCLHQTSCSRRECRNSPLRSEATVELAEYGHRRRVRARHLNCQPAFYLVFRRCGFDHRERGIHGGLRDCAQR